MGKVKTIISGGQTGADIAGLDFAIRHDLPHGGTCPKGRRSEAGRIPDVYDLTEDANWQYPPRTEKNVLNSDATIIFSWDPKSKGSALTARLCAKHKKSCIVITSNDLTEAATEVRSFLENHEPGILNIAGNRESSCPGIHDFVVDCLEECVYLFDLFRGDEHDW